MKILLTGGGSGGHFFPIIAVTEALYDLTEEERLLSPELILMGDGNFDENLLKNWGLALRRVPTGKKRNYFSIKNFTDIFKTAAGVLRALWLVYSDMPDVVFGKGGYASFPALFAARIYKIPIVIHESDSTPGKINRWAGKFAHRIAVSFPDSAKFFAKEKTALTGTPVRKSIIGGNAEEAKEIFQLEEKVPTILVLGGSQGAQKINDSMLDIAGELVKSAQVIHQCGTKNIKECSGRLKIIMENSVFKNRYHLVPFLDDNAMRNASKAADIIISRAGSSAIFEIAAWGIPSIIIPLTNSAQDHQRGNAYSYARTNAAMVIEENNLSPHVLLSEIKSLIADPKKLELMRKNAKLFAQPQAARKIAQEIIDLALEHA